MFVDQTGALQVKIDLTNSLYVMLMVSFCCAQVVLERAFRILNPSEAFSTFCLYVNVEGSYR